jgi:hypothetical protein
LGDLFDEQVWYARTHVERLLGPHRRVARNIERHYWTDAEWELARVLADDGWRRHPTGLYLYAAERALREVQFVRGQQHWEQLAAADARFLAVLEP